MGYEYADIKRQEFHEFLQTLWGKDDFKRRITERYPLAEILFQDDEPEKYLPDNCEWDCDCGCGGSKVGLVPFAECSVFSLSGDLEAARVKRAWTSPCVLSSDKGRSHGASAYDLVKEEYTGEKYYGT